MNKRIVAALVLALALAAGAGAAPLNIVATTSDIADLARRIVGEEAVVTSICSGREDPHYLTAKPSYISRARRADVWMAIGLELESAWELPILNGSRNRGPSRSGRTAIWTCPGMSWCRTCPTVPSAARWATCIPAAIRTTGSIP